MHIVVDGKRLEASEGETILQVARRAGIRIPTLCHHDALEGIGACRLCMVEITHADWHGNRQMVTSCLYPVAPGLEVSSCNAAVRRVRQTVLDLLTARCPDSALIRSMRDENGMAPTDYPASEDGSLCIMCYRCVRACESVGPCAISAMRRGVDKQIAPPFFREAHACIGCGSCAASCPTGHIQMKDTREHREIWGRQFELVRCDGCGDPVMTIAHRDHAVACKGLPADYYATCSRCKRERLAPLFAKVGM